MYTRVSDDEYVHWINSINSPSCHTSQKQLWCGTQAKVTSPWVVLYRSANVQICTVFLIVLLQLCHQGVVHETGWLLLHIVSCHDVEKSAVAAAGILVWYDVLDHSHHWMLPPQGGCFEVPLQFGSPEINNLTHNTANHVLALDIVVHQERIGYLVC